VIACITTTTPASCSPAVTYSALQAARLSGCSPAQLDSWVRTGLLGDEHPGSFTFRDLVTLRMVRSLLDAGVSRARVRRAVDELRRAGEDLAGLRLVTDGDRVWACRDDGQILDALRHGQLVLFVAIDRMAEDVGADVRAFDRERQSFVDRLRGDHPAGSG